jgi:hypothetical protein
MMKLFKILNIQNNGLIKASILVNFIFIIFLYSFYVVSVNKSPFDYNELIFFLKRYGYIFFLNFLSLFYIADFSKLKIIIKLLSFINCFELIFLLITSYSKLFLIFSGFWLICFLYLYYLSLSEINEAYNQSGIFKNDLFSRPITTLDAVIHIKNTAYHGKLTNCSESGFFVVFESLPDNINQEQVSFNIEFEGANFLGHGQVVSISKYFQGIGIKYNKQQRIENSFGWAELVQVLKNRRINFWGLA